MFFEFIRALASILAATAALFGLYLGITRAARIRRREQLFRESLTALTENDPRRGIVYELHRAALADLIARQLTGRWRMMWPWFAWLVIAAVYGQTGYLAAGFLASDAPWNLTDFLIATTGEGPTAVMGMILMLLGIVPQIYRAYHLTLVGRARLARRFYDGESIQRPVTLMDLETARRLDALKVEMSTEVSNAERKDQSWSAVRSSLSAYRRSLVPGIFSTCLGFFAGVQVWIAIQSEDQTRALESLGGFLFLTILLFVITGVSAANLWRSVLWELSDIGHPGTHPESFARVRTDLGRRASQHGARPAPGRLAAPVKRPGGRAGRR